MIKLLVVDDEITSRESLIRNISKMNFDISFIEQADDGVRALDISAKYCPDIVLTDVRMPRMDGIEMSFKLKDINPDIKIIFMSGYSDKEYLKSAIQLRALSYVEKPLDYDELNQTMSRAINEILQEQKKRENAHIHEKLAKNFPLLINEIAIKMINPFKMAKEQFDYTLLGLEPNWDFITVLIQIVKKDNITSFGFYSSLEKTINDINRILENNGLIGLTAVKDNEYILLHIACAAEKRHLLGKEPLNEYLSVVPKVLGNIDFFIAVGILVNGIDKVPDSYNAAVLSLQKGFFCGYRAMLFFDESNEKPYFFNEDPIKELREYVFNENKDQAVSLIRKLSCDIGKRRNTLVNHIQEFFNRILQQLFDLADELSLEVFNEAENRTQFWQSISNFHTLSEVEEFCISKIEFFFQCRREKRDNKSKILQIKKFIENHYMNNDLSVKMISEHTFLSLAYMCSIFKQETDSTINQYITDYRIEKAKELLKNRSYNISDVAESVGFSDSQYFAKIFKKKLNLTPSEYKDKFIQGEATNDKN